MNWTDTDLRQVVEKRPLKCDSAELRAMRVDGLLNLLRDELSAAPSPLPAPALTEDAIVAALKAAPGMAGRVMARVACEIGRDERIAVGDGARGWAYPASVPTTRATALQSLAVALAAASYRG